MDSNANRQQEEIRNIPREELGSVSEEDPTHGLIDDLYILKCSLLSDGKPTAEAGSYLQQICNLAQTSPELCRCLYEWKFIEKELLYFLRGSQFDTALGIAKAVITASGRVPQLFQTKKFLFFLTEKLYQTLGGQKKYRSRTEDDWCMGDEFMTESRPGITQRCREILLFVKKMIEISRPVICSLDRMLFFDLANATLCVEGAQLFNEVFRGMTCQVQEAGKRQGRMWTPDGIYEIRRPCFEPEVVFRDKSMINPRTVIEELQHGVYASIYEQCTSIRDFADISLTDSIDLLLYKRINYTSEEFEFQILECKTPKIARLYRRCLEAGAVPTRGYLNSLAKFVDDPKSSRDACVALYYFIDCIENPKLFTEGRIRSLVQSLEYLCEHECEFEGAVVKPASALCKATTTAVSTREPCSFVSNMLTDDIFGDTADKGVFTTPDNTERCVDTSILSDFNEFGNGMQPEPQEVSAELFRCERYRILRVIEHVYSLVDHRYFFKPSFLVLFRSVLEHVPVARKFIEQFFSDFASRVKGPKMTVMRLDSEEAVNEQQKIDVFDQNIRMDDIVNKEKTMIPLKVKGTVIDSSEE